MTDTILDVQDATIRYGAAVAVASVSLNVCEKEVVALLGANGAGKSSLLKAISGLIPLSKGIIRYVGKDLARVPGYQRARDGIAHVPEGRRIFSTFSIRENLMMGAYSQPSTLVGERLKDIFERFPVLSDRRNQMGGSLSGGEQQILAIGRALMSKPRLLLLDEPSLGLSPIAIDQVYETIRKVHEEGVSILLVEQNTTLALSVADRVYILRTGKVVLSGNCSEISSQDRLLRAYLGSSGEEDSQENDNKEVVSK
jgi:branched-chain amino acid transport system ATP-binding protein